jgi:hypothetical protein
MELARTLNILWSRRRLVTLGALIAALAASLSVYSVGLLPPSLTSRTNVFATASTQLLVDTPDSAFADLANDLTPLETRAAVFARFLATPAALAQIARDTGLPLSSLAAQGPYDVNLPTIEQEPTEGQRSSQIIGEGALYRLRFENNPVLPIVSVFAQAPSEEEARRLADAAPRALRTYIDRIQVEQQTPAERQVVIRSLGSARGGIVNEGANLQIAALVFIVVFGAWCMLLVPAETIMRGWRGGGEQRAAGSNGRATIDRHESGRPRTPVQPGAGPGRAR